MPYWIMDIRCVRWRDEQLSNQYLQIMPLKNFFTTAVMPGSSGLHHKECRHFATNGCPLVQFLLVSNEFLVNHSVPEIKSMEFFVRTISMDLRWHFSTQLVCALFLMISVCCHSNTIKLYLFPMLSKELVTLLLWNCICTTILLAKWISIAYNLLQLLLTSIYFLIVHATFFCHTVRLGLWVQLFEMCTTNMVFQLCIGDLYSQAHFRKVFNSQAQSTIPVCAIVIELPL